MSRELADTLREAALDPDRWPDALERIRAATDGVACGWREEHEDGRFAQSWVGLEPNFELAYVDHHHRHDPWMPAARALPVGVCVPGDQLIPRARLVQTEFYNDLMRPHGLNDLFGCVVERTERSLTTFAVMRPSGARGLSAAQLRTLTELVPQLRHARHTNLVLADRRARGAIELLDALDRPGFLVAHDGALLHESRSGAALRRAPSAPLTVATGRLRLRPQHAERALERALRDRAAAWIRARHAEGSELLLKVQPLPAAARADAPCRAGPAALILAHDPAVGSPIERVERALVEGWALTPAESRVAARVGAGSSPSEVAEALGLSLNTVRFQLKLAYSKLDVDGQRGLSRLVSTLGG